MAPPGAGGLSSRGRPDAVEPRDDEQGARWHGCPSALRPDRVVGAGVECRRTLGSGNFLRMRGPAMAREAKTPLRRRWQPSLPATVAGSGVRVSRESCRVCILVSCRPVVTGVSADSRSASTPGASRFAGIRRSAPLTVRRSDRRRDTCPGATLLLPATSPGGSRARQQAASRLVDAWLDRRLGQ